MDNQEKLREFSERASAAVFKAEFPPRGKFYIDLEFLQDVRLGALMYSISVKEEMEYILYKLKSYNKRNDDHVATHFPALKKTDEDIDKLLVSEHADKIFGMAPFTAAYYWAVEYIQQCIDDNHKLNDEDIPIHIVINTRYPNYPDKLLFQVKRAFEEQLKAQVVITKDTNYMNSSYYESFDVLLLDRYSYFIKQHATPFIEEGKYLPKYIFARPYIEDDIVRTPDEEMTILADTEQGLNICCEFAYIRPRIIL